MTQLTDQQIQYLSSQRLARIATAGANGKPHVVPTSFRYNGELGTLDVGGFRVATTKKFRDVQENSWAAIVIDDLASVDPWRPRMLEVRGREHDLRSGELTTAAARCSRSPRFDSSSTALRGPCRRVP